ncbi:MAG: hypothetical protein WCV85_06645 [Patescibacteria group bacterium]
MPETKDGTDQTEQGHPKQHLSYMNDVAKNGKVRPLPPALIRKTRLGAQQPPCRLIQQEILDWEAIRAASSEPEAPKK